MKKGETNFDISMGAYHGAQACEIVGLFLLAQLKVLPNFEAILYRDDGLAITPSSPRLQEKLRQRIIGIFGEQNLKITIEIGLTRVNFLDITLDLETGLYKPYRKPGDKPLYVSAYSNHPPQILKNLPAGIEKRLSNNSANQEIFNAAIQPFQSELERCGYSYKLEYKPKTEPNKKRRKRNKRKVTWFNPPFSLNIATNVGKEFLKLIDKHFPPGHPLHSVINRQTVKVGYRCLPNMGAQVNRHNRKILNNSNKNRKAKTPPSCNCIKSKKSECPLPGACNQQGVVYQATVENKLGQKETYIGLANKFKKRFYKHRKSMEVQDPNNSTTLSTHFWNEVEAGLDPKVTWRIVENNIPAFNPITEKCQLCIREKFTIVLKPELATLNLRHEIFSSCRHKDGKLLSKPP